MQRVPMTPAGLEILRTELRRYKEVERPKVVRDIEVARAHGDISENSEYEDAKERQSFIEGRIRELESMVSAAQVIDPTRLSGEKVMFGATVTLCDTETEEESTYQIVGQMEADVTAGRISVNSPIARAIMGKLVGDVVRVRVPKGERELEITHVKFV
ncbi:transcription elongation factor GreA [Myxococcota bacterium]|nr:transcription elongation factor GreA [Myxococcota bacterium]